jgi:hypothetical protein
MVGLASFFHRLRALRVKESSALRWRNVALAGVAPLLVMGVAGACSSVGHHNPGADTDAGAGTSGDSSSGGSSSGGSSSGNSSSGGSSNGGSSNGGSSNGGSSNGGSPNGGSSSGNSSSGGMAGASSGGAAGGGSGELSGATPCLDDGACVSEGLFCLEASRVCVECTNDTECPEGMWCNREQCERFDPCTGEEQCGGETPVCYRNAGRCVECFGNTGCPDGERCLAEYCAPSCQEHADCAERGQVCHLAGGYCSDCYLDVGCSAGEFCHLRVCRPRRCTPGQTRCLGGQIVTCYGNESGYGSPTSCGAYGCIMAEGRGACDFPVSEPPNDALNTNGNFDAGGADWHQNGGPVQLTNGMVCATSGGGRVELGWPADVAHAALLTYQQTYRLKFRTSLVLEESWGIANMDVKVGGPAAPYVEYFSVPGLMIPEGIQSYSFTFTMNQPTGSAGIVLMLLAITAEFCVDEIWLVPESE